MPNRKEYLKQLLKKDRWTAAEQEWMADYLETNDLSELEMAATEYFEADLLTAKQILDKRLSERMLKNIHQRIGANDSSFKGIFRLYKQKIAAAAVVLLLAGSAWYILLQERVKQKAFATTTERQTVKLPDGSLVHLEKASSISFPEEFNGKNREVVLKGEAFFEINHDAKHPFIISSSLINTTVLGTSFNMEVREENMARVVVVSGMVQVNTHGNQAHKNGQLVLTANKGAVYNPVSQDLRLQDASEDARFFTQKMSGKFIYKGDPLSKVATDLQRYYNVPVVTDQKSAQCRFYGSFNTTDDLDKALSLIAFLLDTKVRKDSAGNGYIIVGGNCK
ncbi:FecR family protein [Chitinophaga polysaccharea]|uniref:FecR family protein n=1 Tax=Chitinophaga polysaccharea TaxID=1293035 RepID=A0A561P3K4_9BACT|nr:FecR domain-containing protein [Chitinophaga polysaccharea]TWF32688.1 FecR family protein [Chitinophaga polysaccharea]